MYFGNFLLLDARALTSLDQAKSRVMDVTLTNLATLAHAMGYGWTGGCRTKWPGMDFRREGDTWKANYQQPCEGHKAEDRLKITYENFSFKVKNIDYGKPVVDTMKPISQDVGEIQNEDPLPVETTITRKIKTVRTVVHSSTRRWKAGIGASISLKYKSPGSVAGAVVGTFSASVTLSGERESGQAVKELKTMITKLSRLIFLSCSQLAFRVYVSLQLRSKNEFREDPQITWTQLNILLDGEGLRYWTKETGTILR